MTFLSKKTRNNKKEANQGSARNDKRERAKKIFSNLKTKA
jgi:hypothetical protein